MLRAAAGWIWIALLAAAPWAGACLDDWAKIGLGAAAVLATLLWLAHHIRMAPVAGGTRRSLWGNGRWACIAAVAAILLLGWWMAGNAHSVYVAAQRHLTPVASILPAAPGAADRFTAAETMWPLTGILGLLLVAADLGREARWRERFAGCVSLTAASIAAYGILEKLHLLPHLTAQPGFPTSAFGPFDYHGNAAAFLNLAIPAGFYLAFSRSAQLSPKSYILRIIGSASLLLCVVGEGFNISRAGVMIGGVEVAVLVGWAIVAYRPRALGRRFAWLGAAVLAIVLAGGVGVTLFLHPGHRGSLVEDYLQRPLWHSGRFLAWRVAWGMSADAPWFGSGPGSFKLLFPLSPHWIPELYSRWIITWHTPGTRVSGWSYACEDYLQTLVEWGWVGAAFWAVLVGGALVSLVGGLLERGRGAARERWFRFAVLVALLGVYVHAAFDYPLQIVALQLYVGSYLGLGWASAGGAGCEGSRGRGDKGGCVAPAAFGQSVAGGSSDAMSKV